MWLFGALTAFMLLALSFIAAYVRRDEIIANWSKYRDNPLYIFAAPMFKPDNDPRSRLSFAVDNFTAVVTSVIMKVFKVFLEPVMKIIGGMTGSLQEMAGGIMNMRGVFNNMFQKFSSVTNIFQRRYNRTFQALRVTWTKLQESINKTFGAAIASLYAGASAFRVLDNMMRLMTIVAIAILSILLGFVIFFFFILWPILPLIIIALNFVAQTPYAGEVMGMKESFCFAPETGVITANGVKPIRDVRVGDILINGDATSTVTGTMYFDAEYEELYNLFGVQVSGSHIVYDPATGEPVFVRDHPSAVLSETKTSKVYCLITSDHKIPILSNRGILVFADWEEISDPTDLEDWNKTVYAMLNPEALYIPPTQENLESEAAVSDQAFVNTPLGPVRLRNIHPGSVVFDAAGHPTRVTGVVILDSSQVKGAVKHDEDTYISAGAWIYSGGKWKMKCETCSPPSDTKWQMLFTESGTFRIVTSNFSDIVVRDFSDVGSDEICKTYDMVLEALSATH